MRKALLFLRTRWICLLTVALFWAAVLATGRFSALDACAGSPAHTVYLVLFAALVLCSFITVLLFSDSLVKNYLLLSLLIGLFYIVAQPFAYPVDGEYHFLRAFDLTNGRLFPAAPGGFVPVDYEAFAARGRWNILTVFGDPARWFSRITTLSFFPRLRSASYLPFAYIPAALGIGLGRLMRLPLVWVVLLGRLFSHLFFTGVCALAMSRTRKLRSILFLVATSTGAAFMLGTVTLDLPLIAASLLYVAVCFHYCFDEDAGTRIKTGDILLLALSAALIASVKYFGYVLILPLLLFVPRGRYANKARTAWIVCGAVLLVAAIQVFALLRYRGSLDNTGDATKDTLAQLAYMRENPFVFAAVAAREIIGNIFKRLLMQHDKSNEVFEFIGACCALLPMLGALIAPDKPALEDKRRKRLAAYALLASFAMLLLCYIGLYISYTPVGADEVLGVQSRYLLPYYALIMLAFSMPRIQNTQARWTQLISFFALITAVNQITGLLLNML